MLNPKIQKQANNREIKKTTHHRRTQTSCLLLLARKWSFRHQRRYALSHQSFRVSVSVVYFVAGVRWMLGFCFFRVCCSRFAIVYHHHHHHHLSSSGAGSREIISFLVFEILSVCRRRAFDDATMRHRTLFGRRF